MCRGAALLLLVVTGCYQPRAAAGGACSSDGRCPIGQTCVADLCELTGTGTIDAPPDDAIDATPPIDAAPWSGATRVRGVNTSSVEDDPSWTADRLTIVFVSTRNGTADLFLGTRATTTDSFTVAPLDILNTTTANENSPEISADGTTIYFTSDRLAADSNDVYLSHRSGSTWTTPGIVHELSSTHNDDSDVAISPDGLTAMVARDGQLMIATRSSIDGLFSAPVAVPSLNVDGGDAAPSITNRADAVYFHAGTIRDLYYARRDGDVYTQPVPLTELNTSGRDSAPFVSADEHYLVWARADDLFEATR